MLSRGFGVFLLAAGLVLAKKRTFDFTITKGDVSPDGTGFQSPTPCFQLLNFSRVYATSFPNQRDHPRYATLSKEDQT